MAGLPEINVRVAWEPDHVCPLQPLSDDAAVLALVDVLRATSSASAVVERLRRKGLRVGRVG